MLKEAIEKIVSLADPHIYKVGDDTYTNDSMRYLTPHIDRPSGLGFSSLDGVVQAIKAEIARSEIAKPLFVQVSSTHNVNVYTTWRRDNLDRDELYTASAVLPESFGKWMEHEDAIIALRSKFVENDGTKYLLELLASVSDDNSVQSKDNGMTQTVTAKTGVSLATKVAVKPIVKLKPYRTFAEVEQPESEFLIRLKPGNKEAGEKAKIGIIEADGGAWKLTARHNIAEYFRKNLAVEIDKGTVIVTE